MDRPATGSSRHRRFKRVPLDKRVKIIDSESDSVLHGRCIHISPGGLGATIAGKLAIGDMVEIEMTLGPQNDQFRVRAVVRNSAGFNYGFEFLEPSHALKHAILQATS